MVRRWSGGGVIRSGAYSIEGEADVTESSGVAGVGIGTAIVSYIEPHEGSERAFNRWYERDHFPGAVLAGPGAYAGARWVATRECKDLRYDGELFGDPDEGSYLSMAWLLPDAQDDWDGWIGPQMKRCSSAKTACSKVAITCTPRCTSTAGRRASPTGRPRRWRSTAVIQGLVAIAIVLDLSDEGEGTEADEREIETWSRGLVDQELPVVVALRRERMLASVLEPWPEPHVLLLGFVEGDAIDVWERVEPLLETCPGVDFAGPFFATVPGTDLFTDEL